MNPKIVVLMNGGVVCDVIATGPVEIAFLDADASGYESSALIRLPGIDAGQTAVYPFRPIWRGEGQQYGQLTVDPARTLGLMAGIEAAHQAAEDVTETELLEIERRLS